MRYLYKLVCAFIEGFREGMGDVWDRPPYKCPSLSDDDLEKIAAWSKVRRHGELLN
jgi:hypothetical protein